MKLSNQMQDMFDLVAQDEWERIDVVTHLPGSNSSFYIKPTPIVGMSGFPVIRYGVFNADTNIMEADTNQYEAAKQWVDELTRIQQGISEYAPQIMSQADMEKLN